MLVNFSFSSGEKIDDDKCSPVGCPGTDLTDLNTYFAEYVLEDSNANDYFNVYVAGFSFAPQAPAMSMPYNISNSSVVANSSKMNPAGSAKGKQATETTVWYSNEVNI